MLNKDAKGDLNCSNCGYNFSITVRQLQSGKIISCPKCQLKFDTKDTRKALQEVENKLKDFGKKISKTIDIKFKL